MDKKSGVGIILGTFILLAIFGVWYKQTVQQSPPMETIRVATSQTGLLIWIALDKGFFAENEVDVQIEIVGGGTAAMDKVLAGEADFSASSEFTLVANSFKHPNLRVVGTVSTADTIGLTVRKDHGIGQISDLKGKKIGVTFGSAGEFFLRRFLVFHHLTVEDVELISMKPKEIYDSFVNGSIDAGFSWEPNNFNMKKQLGNKAEYFPGQSGQDFHFILTGLTEWITSHQDATQRLLKALVQAEQFTRNNKAEAQRLLINRFGMDSEFLNHLWSKHNLTVSLPQSLLTVADEAAQWRVDNKLTDQQEIPNFLNFLYLDALIKVHPEMVTVVR